MYCPKKQLMTGILTTMDILAKAATIVRRDIFSKEKSVFTGSFDNSCQQKSVPQSLTTLVDMILAGPNINTKSGNVSEAQASLTIAQLLQFNCTIRRREGSTCVISQEISRTSTSNIYRSTCTRRN